MLNITFVLWIASLFAGYSTPLLWAPTTLTFIVLYLEQAMLHRDQLEADIDLLKEQLEMHKQANHNYEELRDRVNAISMKLGFSIKGHNP